MNRVLNQTFLNELRIEINEKLYEDDYLMPIHMSLFPDNNIKKREIVGKVKYKPLKDKIPLICINVLEYVGMFLFRNISFCHNILRIVGMSGIHNIMINSLMIIFKD